MFKSITAEEFDVWVKENRPDIELLTDYVHSKKHVLCRCKKCGNEWLVKPNCLKNGTGCPKCARIRGALAHSNSSKESFLSLMEARKDITIIGDYRGNKKSILVRCNNCQFEWKPTPHNLKNGTRCPKCMGCYSPTPEEFVQWISQNRPNLQALSPYISSSRKIKMRCTICDHEWEVVPNSIKRGIGCPNCSHRSTSFAEQFITSSLELALGKQNIRHRDKKAIGKELDIYVPDLKIGIEYGAWYWHKKRIRADKEKIELAKRKGIRLITIYDAYNEEKPLSSEIITYPFSLGQIEHREELQQLVIRIVEACGVPYIFSLSEWEKIENTASINARKTNTKQFNKEMQKINPNILIIGDYKGSDSYIHVKCRICGYEWDSTPSNLKQGHGCRKCNKVYTPTPEEFSCIIDESRSDITLLGPFVNVTTKILVRCNNCGREWKVVPYSLLAGKKCSSCAGNYSPTTEEFVLKMKAINPSIEVLGEYKNNKTHIECKCLKCNYTWNPTPHDLVGGSGCPKCSRKKQSRST